MSKTDIVVSYHGEDISWIQDLLDCRKDTDIFIYDSIGWKDKRDVPSGYNPVLISENKEKRNRLFAIDILDTSGFEAFTILSHIIGKYNCLSENVVFLQGSPMDQTKGNILQLIKNCEDFYSYQAFGKPMTCFDERGWEKEINKRIIKICELLEIPSPVFPFNFFISSQFAIRNYIIQAKEPEFYQKIYDLFINHSDEDLWKEWGNGKSSYYCHALERIWYHIFNYPLPKKETS